MARRSRQSENTPPDGWEPTQAVENPIINSPYSEPTSYWLYKGGVPSKVPGRRPATYFYKSRKTGEAEAQMALFAEETSDDLPLINALREDVKRWREAGYRGTSEVTRDLLAWWTRRDRDRRLFYCQIEAVETVIYLLEIVFPGRLRATGFQKFAVDAANVELMLKGAKPNFATIKGDFFPRLIDAPSADGMLPLRRLGCKMATGSGKTLVMAMVIAWAFANRGRNPSSKHFPNAVLVCAPNLTVRKRLQVLRPEAPHNYYEQFDLVPSKYREFLRMGKVLVTNWHAFAPKSEHSEGGRSYPVINKGEETNDAFTRDRLGDLSMRMPVLVLNDEGHHCWRGRALTDEEDRLRFQGMTAEQKAAIKEEEDEARVWLAGLDRINNSGLCGKGADGNPIPGVLACLDLSATPFYLGASGYPEGSPFPWLVSDFGLVDAIECGIVKVPRLPVKDSSGGKDDAGRPDPKYFRLWEHVKDELEPGDYIRRGQPRPEAVYKYADGALLTLAAQWKVQFDKVRAEAAGNAFIPPVLIVVCDNTELSKVFHSRISGEKEVETADEAGRTVTVTQYGPSAILPELQNAEGVQHTIRIDSKLLASIETEAGESRDQAALRLREIIDTVGKRGAVGEQVRCIVSVSMLTEGWDANNVTHVLGVRAFGSQLLCEQVVGRGLRRMSYTPDPKGMLQPEYVDVYGIPFSLIPYKGRPKDETPQPDPVYHSIYAMEERAGFELRMPNVESYVYALHEGGIQCDVDSLDGFVVNQEPGEVWLAPTRGYHDGDQARTDIGDFVRQTREAYYATVRPQQIVFKLAQMIMEDLLAGAQADDKDRGRVKLLARHQLFPELVRIVGAYVARKVSFAEGVDMRELGLARYAQLLQQRVRDGILPAVTRGDARLLPVLNSYEPFTSTANVNSQTTRPVVDLTKSHLNRALLHSTWEASAIEVMEQLDCVECFSPNDRQIGLILPYEYGDTRHSYEPDFVVRLRNGTLVMLEIKGPGGLIHDENQVLAKNAAAKKWVAAVNNLGRYGTWAFEICTEVAKLRSLLESHAGGQGTDRPFRFVEPTPDTAWKTCVPLVTLKAAAGRLFQDQPGLDLHSEWSNDWIAWDDMPALEKGMFVARVLGRSMAPGIPDGAYCLFRPPRDGSRQGRVVFVWHAGVLDPHTGGCFTVRIYESERRGSQEGEWEHTRITLRPSNPECLPIILEPREEAEVRVLADFMQVVGRSPVSAIPGPV